MKQTYYIAIAILALLITTATVGISSFAASNNPKFPGMAPNRQEMQQAIEESDYTAWSTIMKEKAETMCQRAEELKGKINEETFAKIQKAHQLMQNGEIESAKAIFEELGMQGPWGKKGFGPGEGRGLHKKIPLESQQSSQ